MGSMLESMKEAIIAMVFGIVGYVIIDALTGDGGIVVLDSSLTAIIGIVWIILFAAIALGVLIKGLAKS